jgi:ATP-dependent RNA helicase CshB
MMQVLDSRIQSFLKDHKFTQLTQVQKQAIPVVLAGKDVIALSKTGTGKTLAYLLPSFLKVDPRSEQTQVLILAPTQELLLQVYQVAQQVQVYFPEIKLLRIGKGPVDITQKAHIVIGSVGRIHQLFVGESSIRLDQLNTVIIDEADMMLESDSFHEIEIIRSKLPTKLQLLVFSATMPLKLNTFMNRFMHHPKLIQIDQDTNFDPKHLHYLIPFKNLDELLISDFLGMINPSLALIFVKDFETLNRVSTHLDETGHRHIALHGKLNVRTRQQHLKQIQNDQTRLILATDLAARGLDFPLLSDVISLGIPRDLSFFTHRSGRTGRAGRSGSVYTFYHPQDDQRIRQLIKDGIEFNHMRFTKEGLKALKPYDFVYRRKPSALDIEIQRKIKTSPSKVKPGYKKKLAQQIDTLKRKHKRQMIQDNIRKLHKEKSKLKQKEKNAEQKD